MITGFNTDVDHEGQVFHVQTEDKGVQNPVVESLVYCGGEIIESRSHSYADLAENGRFSDERVLARMEAQHQALIREIRNGTFDADGPKPFGHNIITNRSLDEVVVEFLRQQDTLAGISIELFEGHLLLQGTCPTIRVKISEEATERPIAGAQISITLLSTNERPREVFRASSGDDGFVEASFEIPERPEADMAIVCRVQVVDQQGELRQMVYRARPGTAHRGARPS